MKTYIGYSTSLHYWLANGMDETDRAHVTNTKSLNDAAYKQRDLVGMDLDSHGLYASTARGWPERNYKKKGRRACQYGRSEIHVLVPECVDRSLLDGFRRHCWSSHIPDGSFCRLPGNIYVSTPEFTFLQMAGQLSLTQTILVGYWLCSAYRLREDGLLLPAEQVTSVDRIQAYLRNADGCYGAKKAREALRWVVDKARSPMEIGMSMLASLPYKLGGYGFGLPVINYRINASDYDSSTLDRPNREYFEIDLYWKRKRVGIEYDGAPHYEPDQIRKDKRRLNCLMVNGERILVVMYDQLSDEEVRETLMNQVAKLMGVSRREVSESEAEARDALVGLLFGGEFAI